MCAEVEVRGVQVLATEEEDGIGVGSHARGIGNRRALTCFVGRIEHQFHAIQLEECPIAVVSGLRRGRNFEAQDIAVEMNCGRHVKNLKQRSKASNINGHTTFLYWWKNISLPPNTDDPPESRSATVQRLRSRPL